ncbi:hypothetical protein FB451DRAFT_1451958 [Mycena latifolia]|nr:hypothetical protein FB451DRAFT_1451958 [Mycena latifolia]
MPRQCAARAAFSPGPLSPLRAPGLYTAAFPFPRHCVFAAKPAPFLARLLHATLASPSCSCGRFFYRSSVAPLDIHIEVILMCIAQLCAPLTLRSPFHRLLRMPLSIAKSAEQQASVFLHQKPKVGSSSALPFLSPFPSPSLPLAFFPQVAGPEERTCIVDAVCARGEEMMMHRVQQLGRSALSRAAAGPEEHPKIVAGRIVDLATNYYGYYVLQKALDCKEEVCLLIVSELLLGDESGDDADAFENLEESVKDGIVDELLGQPEGAAVFGEIPILIIIDTVLEHGSERQRQMALGHVLTRLLDGKETLDRVAQCMCDPAKGARRAMIVNIALLFTGSQLIASVLPTNRLRYALHLIFATFIL